MKIRVFALALICLLLSGCGNSATQPEQTAVPVSTEAAEEEPVSAVVEETAAPAVIRPLPDTTMEARNDSILHVSFAEDGIYRDEAGKVLLRVQIYTYDKFDMVDISGLNAGDTILLCGEEITVSAVETNAHGTVLVNGGLDEGGFDLATDDSGVYYAQGYSDMKSWILAGEAEFPVSEGFVFRDSADLETGVAEYTAEDLLAGIPAAMFGYQPHNTTVRVENGQVAEMERIYTP